MVDAVGDAAFEASESVLLGAPLRLLPKVVGTAFGIPSDLGESREVDNPVELSVAASIEPMSVGPPGARGQGCCPVGHGELRLRAESPHVPDVGKDLRCGELSHAGDGLQLHGRAADGSLDFPGCRDDLLA